ncbi:hypothetical protein [Pedobacter sp. MC2016-24]|uniref:hypothetical protein n=1 Tax=Pedobacter sp. MC2016-24 TaxID=2780090 RepID=UPI0018805860|nr:hypothetical protein [Pedobacter sp. MC2016-24]MBE9597789.1 hypothetical protein [Pedobacter sp. MC2016-24]
MNSADQKYQTITQEQFSLNSKPQKPYFSTPFKCRVKTTGREQLYGSLVIIGILLIISGVIWCAVHLLNWMMN